jgi:hypothetical protein
VDLALPGRDGRKLLAGYLVTGLGCCRLMQADLGNLLLGGAMGGLFERIIVGADRMYTTIHTADGLAKMPNAGVLCAAVGPARKTDAATTPG